MLNRCFLLVVLWCWRIDLYHVYGNYHFKYFNEKAKCSTEYTITGRFPIEMKRTYSDGRTEFIVLQPIHIEDAAELYELISKSKKHLQRYAPFTVQEFGVSLYQTKKSIQHRNELAADGSCLTCVIGYKIKEEDPLRLIGLVGVHSYGYHTSKSIEGSYSTGDPTYIQVEGVAGIAIQALFNHFIAISKVDRVNLVIHKNNEKSNKIANRLYMQPNLPESYRKWKYAEKKHEVLAYTLSAESWIKLHWPKG